MQTFSFTKADRLLNRPEFLRLAGCGKRFYNRHFIAVYCPGRADRIRLGITITKKVGCAAIRNRIRRRAREYFRQNRHRMAGQWDINIIAKKSAAGLTTKEIFSSLKNLFDRIPDQPREKGQVR
ncbi:ribonuclease P protein component [Desulfococcaceae bacterium HSG8]|nr:ribonuclease P protein component [Desulfococcaceae bacterium HSG8]